MKMHASLGGLVEFLASSRRRRLRCEPQRYDDLPLLRVEAQVNVADNYLLVDISALTKINYRIHDIIRMDSICTTIDHHNHLNHYV